MNRACLAGVTIGDGLEVAVMGVLNVSPESFYAGSVVTRGDELLRAAERMVEAGAAFIDVGAMSTAPYLAGGISEQEEAERLAEAIHRLATRLDVPISADTSRSAPARAALEGGARIINDVTGLTEDRGVARLVAEAGAGLIVMARERGGPGQGSPVESVMGLLDESLRIAAQAGVPSALIVVDPGIGFFRGRGIRWHEWDARVLAGLRRLRDLGRPVCVGVSRKSFIGELGGAADPSRRLPGSLAATAAAILNGAHLIRSHDVEETLQAARVVEAIRRAGERESPPHPSLSPLGERVKKG